MLYKTELKHTEDDRLSISSNIFCCYSFSSRLFVLSFVLCLFLSFSYASEYEPSDYSLLSDVISEYFPSSFSSYIPNESDVKGWIFYQTSDYDILDVVPVSGTGINSVKESDSSKFCLAGAGMGYYNGGSNWYQLAYLYSPSTVSFTAPVYCYRFVQNKSQSELAVIRFPVINNSASQWTQYGVYYYKGNDNQNGNQGRTYFVQSSINVNSFINFTNGRENFLSDQVTYYLSTGDVCLNYVPVSRNIQSYVSDDRLKLYTTQSSSQGSLLHVDMSYFYQFNNGVSSDYSFSDVVLTLDCDGTEISFSLSPSGSQYEFLNTSTATTRVYGYIVPYSFFSVSQYQNCSVVKVDFTRSISSPGGTGSEDFKISCDYPLQITNINGNAQDFAPVTLAPVPSVTVVPDQSTVQDWSDNTSYHSPAFGHNGSYVLLNSLPIFPDWVDKYTIDCTRVNKTVDGITLNLWIDLDNPYVSVNTALVDIPITAFFTPESYLKDNVLTDFYDVVVFKVWSDTGKTSVDGYLYFYTEKYDLKYQNNLVVQELSLEYDSLNLLSSGFSLIRTGLDNIDNNTAAYFTDSLFNDTIVISWLQTLNNTNSFGFVDVVNAIEDIPQYDDSSVVSGIASVVSAIEGIDSPDLSDLESKLDTLINFFVADGSTENASSRTYRNWLRGVDDNTSRTVTYYADNVFSIVHDVFDLFDADGSVYYPPDSEDVVSTDYINFVKLFIEKMNSSTITNTGYNKYLRGFFQAGFDPHLIDGGL